ncbi:MAG: flagellar protein FlaG [Undibacterium sp.]|uniref:flagellar protein FlaG n=1 Tax=Undibacterium sp. TaxID=1914977 RepID=UPI002725712C|nr:flagellar protein FlaG [Undibacterium sp.]MDO8651496.1 flagellar protein FlaG [Undibacterium sp.]
MTIDQLTATGQTGAAAQASAERTPSISLSHVVSDKSMHTSPLSPAAKPVDTALLKKSVAAINDFVQPHLGNIEFSLDDDSGKTLLKIIDKETNTVLMQFPSKEALALSQNIGNLKGFFIKDSA